MTFNLKLPDERGRQLQMIAEAEGKSVVDVITDHIRAKVREGVIPEDLPNVEVSKRQTQLRIAAPGFEGTLPLVEVGALAEALRGASQRSAPDDVERKQKLLDLMSGLTGVKIKRMGAGVKLVSPISGKEYPLAFGVASDLADQIERSAK